MEEKTYQKFTRELTIKLATDSRVLGLVSLGSMANLSRQDDWSDHDFFVIVETGTQTDFRQNLGWLPNYEHIVIAYQETDHGLKVIYDDAHMLEFAVFDMQELFLARVNDYAVLIDNDAVGKALEKIRKISRETTPRTDQYYWGQFLAHLIIGFGRYLRGERLSGHVFIKQYALADILPLFAKHIASREGITLDDLDAHRRFESAFPEIGASLDAILLMPVPQACLHLLKLAQTQLGNIETYPEVGVEVVRRYISDELERL